MNWKTCLASFAFAASLFGAAPSAHAIWFHCVPENVVEVVGSRVHVYCSNSIAVGSPSQTIRFIAISTSNSAVANRFMSTANAAFMSGKRFLADIPSSSATNVSGCSAADCRTPAQFGLEN